MAVPDGILYLTESDVRRAITVADAVTLAEKGVRADGAGEVAGDKFYMDVGGRGFIKPFSGYLAGEQFAFVKTFSYFPGNPERFGCPTTSSVVLLFDAQTGLLVCLMEAGWVTALKTGASTTVTAAALANPDAATVTIFGAGQLGRMHLRALSQRFDLGRAIILDVLPEAAGAYAAELEPALGFSVQPVPLRSSQQAVQEADIVLTVTTGDQPLFEHAWLRPGAFVARLGSYQEIALDVITEADKIVVDSWHYVSPRIPELRRLIETGRLGPDDVHAEWPDIVAGRRPGRESPDEVIVYIALGIWGEYAALLPEVYRRARALGLGQRLER
ncbi:MAG: ornithine cyclodeaminase family protein [Anaerolineae bacterium]|jgi:ornithine cyclodeaminase/alanine dehydrogenase-like protein (mu-crystallin family)